MVRGHREQAAASGLAISKLAIYDTPFAVDDSHPRLPPDLTEQLEELIAAGRRGDADELFQRVVVGIPEHVVAQMRHAPFRPGLEAIAHTLVYDATLLGDLGFPAELIGSVTVPTLVIDGELSPPVMHSAAEPLVKTLPKDRRGTLAGEGHDISAGATAAALQAFLSS